MGKHYLVKNKDGKYLLTSKHTSSAWMKNYKAAKKYKRKRANNLANLFKDCIVVDIRTLK